MHKQHKKYLRFYYNKILYEFNCLVFGLALAPYTFSKLMKPVMQILHSNGISCISYLDNFLILGSSEDECYKNTDLVISLLSSLGFLLITEKNVFKPSTGLFKPKI